jgi:hypothetical protein
MINLLREVVGSRQRPSDVYILQDMQRLSAMHFETLAPAVTSSLHEVDIDPSALPATMLQSDPG